SLLLAIGIATIIWLIWNRIYLGDPDRWHMDPADADEPGRKGWRMIGREAPRFPGDPTSVLSVLTEIAFEEPNVRLLDGDIDEGMVTYAARSNILGTKDYITVKAVAEGPKTKLGIISRSGALTGTDLGRNRERLDRWLAELEIRLAE
ncbi:MAG: hypothetical protein ACR2OY_11795, partial [Boseongicola sp.]